MQQITTLCLKSFELGLKETNIEKRRKIADLTLSDDEWDRVRLFGNLLGVCVPFTGICILIC